MNSLTALTEAPTLEQKRRALTLVFDREQHPRSYRYATGAYFADARAGRNHVHAAVWKLTERYDLFLIRERLHIYDTVLSVGAEVAPVRAAEDEWAMEAGFLLHGPAHRDTHPAIIWHKLATPGGESGGEEPSVDFAELIELAESSPLWEAGRKSTFASMRRHMAKRFVPLYGALAVGMMFTTLFLTVGGS